MGMLLFQLKHLVVSVFKFSSVDLHYISCSSYNAIRRASAFTISGSVLLQQVNIHTESDTNRSQVSQQSAETGEGFDGDEDDKEVYNAKIIHSSLLQRLKVPRNQCVVPVLQSWIEAGNELGVYEMKIACTRLKCQKKYKQALEVIFLPFHTTLLFFFSFLVDFWCRYIYHREVRVMCPSSKNAHNQC